MPCRLYKEYWRHFTVHPEPSGDGHIYVALSGDRKLIKVGHTTQSKVSKRIKQLRTVGQQPWVLLTSVTGTREQEADLHRTLDRWRFDRLEYYRRSPELVTHLRAYANGYLRMPKTRAELGGQGSLGL